LATITTQQIVSFIQNKIAETHAAGEDILGLLKNPEIAFSLQVLDGSYKKVVQAPVNAAAEDNKNTGTEQLFMAADTNTNHGVSQTTV
jgi:hypothetical protein